MMDLQAAIGIHQLAKLARFQKKREELFALYRERLRDVEEILLPEDAAYPSVHSRHLFLAFLDIDRVNVTREEFRAKLRDLNVGTGLHYTAVHLFSHYRERLGHRRGTFPNAEWVSDRVFSLPLMTRMGEGEVNAVVDALKEVLSTTRKGAR